MRETTHFPQFVAEVSSNHQANLSRAIDFIDCAASLGCDAVKFQLFKVKDLFAPEVLSRSQQHRERVAWELPLTFLPELSTRAREKGLSFACTPFYLEAVEQLYPFVEFYKIASYELLWTELLVACAKTEKPLVLSTGMANLDEIDQAVESYVGAGGKQLTLLHCVSGYPTPLKDCNLAAIRTLSSRYDCPAGWSDHSVSQAVIHRAVHHWGASMIEFHLDIDGVGDEYRTGHCWLPDQIGPVIREIHDSLRADGDGRKAPMPSEEKDRNWRTDPKDGLRPFQIVRQNWRNGTCSQ
jgi:N-acetylneuraminate synthase